MKSRSNRRAASEVVRVVVIGVSTGGPSALEVVLSQLPKEFPVPVLVAQHMPKLFTGGLAERLDRQCALRVVEGQDGAQLRAGCVWLAPGDTHMEVARAEGEAGRAAIRLHREPSADHCRPSVDLLFRSAVRVYGAGTLALVMTGMGSDGLEGARMVHEVGGIVLTQDQATSAVWGMPGRVFEAGISGKPLALDELADELVMRVRGERVQRQVSGAMLREVADGVL